MTTLAPDKPAIELPDKLSELIKLASSDIKSFDRSVFYPTFNVWYVEISNKYCIGCFAGALIFSRLKDQVTLDPDNNYIIPEQHCKEGEYEKLLALNSFRGGLINDAIKHMYGKHFNIGREDLKYLENPPKEGAFLTWDEMDTFLEWADQSAEILTKYETRLFNNRETVNA